MRSRWPFILMSAFLIIAVLSCTRPSQNLDSNWMESRTWSNVQVSKSEDPHAMGIEIDLWRHDGDLAGYMNEYVGPVADPPAGKLEALRIDDGGRISFTSRLSVGVVRDEASAGYIPARNVYTFDGVLSEESITGTLHRKQLLPDGKEVTEEEAITLKRIPRDPQAPNEGYEAWLKSNEEALRLRGPKW